MTASQKTIGKAVSVKGTGLHTGHESEVIFKPAAENSGIKFQRTDLEGKPTIRAIVDNVVDTARGTTIAENNAKISTVEHVLSAVSGLEIDNLIIEITGPETPILDGSSKHFVNALMNAGIVKQNARRKVYKIKQNISYTDEEKGIEILAFPDDKFSINVLIDYNSSVLVNQFAHLESLSQYKDEISECRTFVFLHDLEYLLSNNLIRGGDLENAIVFVDKEVSKEELDRLADLFKKPRVEVLPQLGILNNVDLHFKNEQARHKLLDLIGDLTLVGMPITGRILATRPGHYSNVQFAKKLRQIIKKESSKNKAPEYDPNAKPHFDINQIKQVLPHRNPFLLVDKIMQLTEDRVVGVKNVTMNESFFAGHFPEEPVMPGVLIVEAMSQVGGMLVLNTVDDPQNYLPYFLKIDQVKFKKKVVPGDTLVFHMELLEPIRRGIANMKGQAFVGDTVVAEGVLMAQIVKKPGNK